MFLERLFCAGEKGQGLSIELGLALVIAIFVLYLMLQNTVLHVQILEQQRLQTSLETSALTYFQTKARGKIVDTSLLGPYDFDCSHYAPNKVVMRHPKFTIEVCEK